MSNNTLNKNAHEIAMQMVKNAEQLNIKTHKTQSGVQIIDAGNQAQGSPEAGRLFSLICMGNTATIDLTTEEHFISHDTQPLWTPAVRVTAHSPLLGCMCSQYAGWTIKGDNYFAMGSGPARSAYASEEIIKKIGYKEETDVAVLALEATSAPQEETLQYIAESCKIKPQNLTIIMAPTASTVGSIQIAARIVETGMHKLEQIGFDITKITAGYGTAPIAPIASNDGLAMGWTNDGILYGGRTWYTVSCEDSEIEAILQDLPASASKDYGTPFFDLLKQYEWDFYKIDGRLFAPAITYINNTKTGHTFRTGKLNAKLLADEWL